MAQRYPGHFNIAPQHADHRTAMAPPSIPLFPAAGMGSEHYHAHDFPESGIPFSPSMTTTIHAQIWPSSGYPPTQNTFSAFEVNNLATSSGQIGQDPPVSLDAQDSSGRTRTISSKEWLRVKPIINRLWIQEKRSLEETRVLMAKEYKFTASLDQYKKQTKRWKWFKNMRDEDAKWMLQKADARQQIAKNTEFKYHGQILTTKDIMQRLGRKKVELDTGVPLEAPTPADISYATPRDLLLSPSKAQAALNNSMRSVWTPPSRPIRQSQHFRLTWNGLTYRDYDNQYINGCEDARSGRALEAETKLRAALDGFHNLLSTTDQKCVEVARKLAIFYAEHERIREAELIFDWLTEAHVQEFGRADRKTYDYLLSVVRFYQDQHRPREAAALLDRIILTCEENKDQAARPKHPEVNIAAQTSQSGYEHQVSHLPENASGTAWLYEGLDEIESAQPGDESVDEVWNDLLKRCEDLPEQLTSHSLLVHTALVKHQAQSGHTRKLNEAIEQADRVINRLLHSNQLKTDDLYDSCVRLAKEFAKAGRYSSANKAFSRIESDAQDSSSFDPARRIELLKSIGIFYQNEGRWEDAAPRFEQALAASLSLYCTGNHEVRRLETALENRHYSVDSSHDEDHTHCRPIPTYRVDGVPEVVVVVARQRNWLE